MMSPSYHSQQARGYETPPPRFHSGRHTSTDHCYHDTGEAYRSHSHHRRGCMDLHKQHTHTHTLASVLMSGNITSPSRLYTATESVSRPHSHRQADDIFNVREHNCHLPPRACSLSQSLAHIHVFSTSQLLATESPQSSFFFLSFSLFFCLFIIQCQKPQSRQCAFHSGEKQQLKISFFSCPISPHLIPCSN